MLPGTQGFREDETECTATRPEASTSALLHNIYSLSPSPFFFFPSAASQEWICLRDFADSDSR